MTSNEPLNDESLFGDNTRYKPLRYLNRVTNHLVVLAKDLESNECYAIKLLSKRPEDMVRTVRESQNHRKLNHPHVIQVRGTFETEYHHAIVMELANGGDLCTLIRQRGRLDEDFARWIFQQLIVAVDYIHRQGLCNRDIKPANILLNDAPKPIIKICDFGNSKHDVCDNPPNTKLGTIPYMDPVVLFIYERSGMPYDGKKADIWSCGAVLFKMITGRKFFTLDAENIEEYRKKMPQRLERLNTLPFSAEISDACKNLIRNILKMDPEERPSIQEIQAHPWYQQELPEGALDYNACLH